MPINQDEPVFDKLTARERKLLRIPPSGFPLEQPPSPKEKKQIQEKVKRGGAEWE